MALRVGPKPQKCDMRNHGISFIVIHEILLSSNQQTASQEEEYQPISLKDMPSTSSVDESASGSPSHLGRTPEHHSVKHEAGGHTPRSVSTDTDGSADRSGASGSGRSSPRVVSPKDKKGNMLNDSPSKIILTGHAVLFYCLILSSQ